MIFRSIDQLVPRFIKSDEEPESAFLNARHGADNKQQCHYDMDTIDSKSSALLTHISLMFVVLSLLLVSDQTNAVVMTLLALELACYLMIAMALLRCIDTMGPPLRDLPRKRDDEDDRAYCAEIDLIYRVETTRRRSIYQHSLRAVAWLTLLLIPIVVFEYVPF